jgi:hypothetical protein
MHDEREDRASRGLPWAFVLDPVANARVISDVQRRGLHAARLLVDQVVSNLDRVNDGSAPSSGGPPGDPGSGPDPVTDLVRAWSRLLSRSMEAFETSGTSAAGGPAGTGTSDGAARTGQHGGAMTIDVAAGGDMGTLAVNADEKGAFTEPVELWLHNPSHEQVGPLRIHLGDLHSPEGSVVPNSVVGFEPATLDELPFGAKQRVTVTLSFPEPLPPGVYRSVIQIAGLPDLSIPVRLSIHPAPS